MRKPIDNGPRIAESGIMRVSAAVRRAGGQPGLGPAMIGMLALVLSWGCTGPMAAEGPARTPRPVVSAEPAAVDPPPGTARPDAAIAAVSTLPATRQAGPSPGSLWDERGSLGILFVSQKARRVGDIITIRIVESSSATNRATTKTDRSSSLSAGLDSFFGSEKRFPSDSPFFNPFGRVSGSLGSEFEGTGSTQRSGALTAYMTAKVVDVLPNGNFIIEGNREVRVNNENQLITVTGMVRPRDISADNVIQSTYIADARIAYSGKGVLNDRQRPGWFVRMMDKVWPF